MSNLTTDQFREHQAENCELCGGHGYIFLPPTPEQDDIRIKCECQLLEYELD